MPWSRRVGALALCLVAYTALTVLLVSVRPSFHGDASGPMSIYLVVAAAVAALGGIWPAVAAGLSGAFLLDYFFVEPVDSLAMSSAAGVVTVLAFLVVTALVATLVELAARRSQAAAKAASGARALARIAARSVSSATDPLPELLQELLVTFEQRGVAVVRRRGDRWLIECMAGEGIPTDPEEASTVLPIAPEELLLLRGVDLPAGDRATLAGFAAQLAAVRESQRLYAEALAAEQQRRANEMRTALLTAVSHDLRTPLASVKAATTSLLAGDVTFPPEQVRALLETVDEETDRLTSLVEDLLDMSRLQAGSLEVVQRSVGVQEVLCSALASLGPKGRDVRLVLRDPVPRLRVDPVLLERAIANLVGNAILHGRGVDGRPDAVVVEVAAVADRVYFQIVDRGPGVPRAQREAVFQPFQRLGDSPIGTGVGLGLAVARGFVSSIGGELMVEDTPGGGCTMVVSLPLDPTR